jgi:hypothetical protein
MVKFTGIGPVNGVLLVYFISFVALLFVFALFDAVSLNNCSEVELLMVVPGIKIIPDSSTLLTPSEHADGFAV